jgi:nitroreductase
MADNYLEKRYDEVFGSRKTIKKVGQSLDSLLLKNRSCRGYDHSVPISEDVLRRIVGVNTKIPSARNQQVLRFKLVVDESEVALINNNIKLGGALPHLNLPFPDTEPIAFIVVTSIANVDHNVYIDLGISLQSMLLKSVEIGFNGIIIGAFDAKSISKGLGLNNLPLAVVAIGKSIEKYRIVDVPSNGSLKYYRDENGVHCVPKLSLDDIIIK